MTTRSSLRPLLPFEIATILADLRIDPSNADQPIWFSTFFEKLSCIHIDPTQFDAFHRELVDSFEKRKIQYGDPVGISCAQSMGEKGTQLTLNTFHSAGMTVQQVVQGIPRFCEIIGMNQRQKQKMCTIYVATADEPADEPAVASPRSASSTSFLCRMCDRLLVYATCGDMVSYQLTAGADLWLPARPDLAWCELSDDRPPANPGEGFSYWTLVFLLDPSKMVRCRMTPKQFNTRILESIKDDIRLGETTGKTRVPVEIRAIYPVTSSIERGEIRWVLKISASASDADGQRAATLLLNLVLAIPIKGKPTCSGYMVLPGDGEPVIQTIGGTLMDMIQLPEVDTTRTMSNSVWEIYALFGIEALREYIIEEITQVISSDSFVNRRHIYLLADVMTYYGQPTSISRYGMRHMDNGWLSKATFEESLDIILHHAFTKEVDSLQGVSASVTVGMPCHIGTGMVNLLMKKGK